MKKAIRRKTRTVRLNGTAQISVQINGQARGRALPLLNYYLVFLPVNIGESLKKHFQHHDCNLEFATWIKPIHIRTCIRQARKLGFNTWASIDHERAFLYGLTLIKTEKKMKSTILWLKNITQRGAYGHAMFNDPESERQLIRIIPVVD